MIACTIVAHFDYPTPFRGNRTSSEINIDKKNKITRNCRLDNGAMHHIRKEMPSGVRDSIIS